MNKWWYQQERGFPGTPEEDGGGVGGELKEDDAEDQKNEQSDKDWTEKRTEWTESYTSSDPCTNKKFQGFSATTLDIFLEANTSVRWK